MGPIQCSKGTWPHKYNVITPQALLLLPILNIMMQAFIHHFCVTAAPLVINLYILFQGSTMDPPVVLPKFTTKFTLRAWT